MAPFSQGSIPTRPIMIFIRNNYLSALFLLQMSEFWENVSTKRAEKLVSPVIELSQLRGLSCFEI